MSGFSLSSLAREVSALDIGLLVGMYILTMTGITVGYHRYLAHKAFEAHPAVAASLTVLGAMAGQGANLLGRQSPTTSPVQRSTG